MRCIFSNRTIGIGCFSVGTNRTIGTNGPSVWRIVSVCVYWTCVDFCTDGMVAGISGTGAAKRGVKTFGRIWRCANLIGVANWWEIRLEKRKGLLCLIKCSVLVFRRWKITLWIIHTCSVRHRMYSFIHAPDPRCLMRILLHRVGCQPLLSAG